MLLFGCTYMLLLLYPATNPADTFMKCNCILNTTSKKICFVILGSQKKMKYFFTGGNIHFGGPSVTVKHWFT